MCAMMPGMWVMGLTWMLLSVALLVLVVVAIIRLWPKRPTPFDSGYPDPHSPPPRRPRA